jgi:hypothetical protein
MNQARIAWNGSVMSRITRGDVMKKYLSGFLLLGASMTIAIAPALAETNHAAAKHAVKKHVKNTTHDEKQPELAGFSSGTEFHCELGNKLTIYESNSDKNRIGLRWNKSVHELTRVETTTGANRFEDKNTGLVWIGIPAKGMLLDSKKGQQLANECRNRDQMQAMRSKA